MEMIAQAGGLQAGGYAPQTQQHLQEMQQMQLHQLHRNNGGGEDSSAGDPPHSKRMKRQEEKEWAQSTTWGRQREGNKFNRLKNAGARDYKDQL